MPREIINTELAPRAIGPYSQAVRTGNTIYLSGQIPLKPGTMELVTGGIRDQAARVFENLAAVAAAAGGSLDDFAKLTIYLADLNDFIRVNEVMAEYFQQPWPARAVVGVAQLPKDSRIEMDAVMVLTD